MTKKIIKLNNGKSHESITFFQEPAVGLKAIVAIHNTARGPAIGGTRLWPYPSFKDALNDALNLSRAMTYKAAASDLDFGGGKAVIWSDPKEKSSELFKAYGSCLRTLEGKFYTGQDANISMDDIRQIVKTAPRSIAGKPDDLGGGGDTGLPTAEGILHGIRACMDFLGIKGFNNITIAIHGVGKVGYAMAQLLSQENKQPRIIVADIRDDLVQKVKQLFGAEIVSIDRIHKVKCDIYSPCLTLGGVLNKKTIPELKCRIVAGATNNQLLSPSSDSRLLFKRGIIYAPDYVINAGGVINVAHELHPLGYSRGRVSQDLKKIYHRIYQILYLSKKFNIPTKEVSDAIAESKISAK